MREKNELRLVLKIYQYNVFRNHILNIYMYKTDLTLNDVQWLICYKNQPTNQPNKQTNKANI